MWLKALLGLEIAAKIAIVTYGMWMLEGKNGFSGFCIQAKASLSHSSYFDERSHNLLPRRQRTPVHNFRNGLVRAILIVEKYELNVYRVVPIAYGTLLLGLALYKAAEYWKASSGFKGFKLVKVLVLDQLLYFAL